MTNPFVEGRVYRRRAIHEQFGGQEQGGMSTPAKFPFIFLFTGESGRQHGYSDGFSDEGIFLYTGEGQVGDMQFIRANAALRDHLEDEKDVHLFASHSKAHVRYLGQFVCTGHHLEDGPDTTGKVRKRIVFELTPLADLSADQNLEMSGDTISNSSASIANLRLLALNAAKQGLSPKERKVNAWARSEAIRKYALLRAKGICEGCKSPAPFYNKKGLPFLEVHHILRLTDGGPDHPAAVAAVCPNCPRRAHHAADSADYNEQLLLEIQRKEANK